MLFIEVKMEKRGRKKGKGGNKFKIKHKNFFNMEYNEVFSITSILIKKFAFDCLSYKSKE